MRQVLVTGGAGFIGSNFVRQWGAHNPGQVTALDALTYSGNRENLAGLGAEQLRFVQGDMCDRALRKTLIDRGRAQAATYSWQRTTEATLAAYRSLERRPRRCTLHAPISTAGQRTGAGRVNSLHRLRRRLAAADTKIRSEL
ncbi:NAD-dependent epimerase/dehydratase family protein [Romeria aff. gracilis LEGE 07310]|uniref:NAD-dependent epimerase/dehydratase family protein n=1 Tax=Vasconcelosia minhoensis LEGE 07310 TaxID=915328 RepID=A0A8J7B0G7_9CYAN|nr:NAD-dependent epimerase/dehydratase family protein [Romeria gracilis]MBE9079932.1 NAD-dependent epimerase/dehydratase family protein [Romeria aff. gracilis LEGE 07310]